MVMAAQEVVETLVETVSIHHDEREVLPAMMPPDLADDSDLHAISTSLQLDHEEKESFNAEADDLPSPRLTNSKREKVGRTKKERKSLQGRKAKSGVVREPLQLSLDVRTIKTLEAMGVNRSQLFEELLQQHGPFLEMWASLHDAGEGDDDEKAYSPR